MNINASTNILPPTNLVNPSNSHFSDPLPEFSSRVGAVSGCTGSLTSPQALRREGLYSNYYYGGKNKKSKRKHIGKKMVAHKKRSMKKRSMKKRSMKKRSMKKRSMKKRSMTKRRVRRGGSGYGMNKNTSNGSQGLAGPSAGYADITTYNSEAVANPANMNASNQYGGKKKQRGGGMFKGYVAFTPSYTVNVKNRLPANDSALANPPPIKRTNDCLNTWKHLGSENKPYNKVWN